jgi:ATPase subunit of ABC transporter with duplicated ATPase domains
VIRLDSVSKQHGKQILLLEASCAINRGEKVGLVGPNGAGKSTIFRLITREEEPDGGQIAVDRGTSIGHFRQDVGDMKGQPVVAAAMDGAGPVSEVAARLRELEAALADPDRMDEMDRLVEEFGQVQGRFEELGGYALDAKAREILAGLGFAQELMDRDVGELSGGWKMRVALARILLMRPDALLLDEPTNHLDLDTKGMLIDALRGYEGTMLFVSHDRHFLHQLSNRVLELLPEGPRVYGGGYSEYVAQVGYEAPGAHG